MNARRCLPWLAALLVASPAFGQTVHPRLEVRLRPEADRHEVAASLASGFGRVVAKRPDGAYVFELTGGRKPVDVIQAWSTRPSVASAKSVPPGPPREDITTGSYRKAKQFRDSYERAFRLHWEAEGEEPEVEIPGLDFLEAYLQHLEVRAYPGDTIDFTGHRRVAEERLKTMNDPRPATTGWEFIGPTNLDIPYRIYYGQRAINGRVGAVAYHPTDPNTLYLGGAQGGLWRTTDRGVSWTPLTDNWPLLFVSSIAVHPTNPDTIYVGTGDYHGFSSTALGIMKTTDGGTTWTRLGAATFNNEAVSDIILLPSNPDIILASCGITSGGRVYRSTDGGQTWSAAINVVANWDNLAIGMPISGVPTLWAVGSGGRVYRSLDNGATWTQITVAGLGTGTLDIACSKVSPQTAYLLDGGTSRIWKTTDNGATWTNTTNNFPSGYNWSQAWYDWHIATSSRPGGIDVVYVGLIDIAMSRDGGATWRNTGGANFTATYSSTAITHNDQHCAAVNPNNPNEVLIGNDGGCYILTYNPTTDTVSWANLNRNLGITQFYTLAAHPTSASTILGGTQDNASPHAKGDILNWTNPGAGDGAGCAIDPVTTNTRYDSYQGQNIRRTDNAYASSFDITPSWSGHSTPFIGMLWLDRTDPRYLYANTNFMNRYDKTAGTWTLKLGNFSFGTTNLCLETAVGDSNTLYVGTSTGKVYVSRNFGSNWTSIDRVGLSGGIPNRAVMWIRADPANKNDVLVCLSGTGTSKVWRCADTTAATPQWTDVGGLASGVPDVPANCIERHPASPQTTWFLGTDVGVYRTDNAGATWTDFTSAFGLPNVEVTRLQAVPGTGKLVAATFGRGMWQVSLAPPEEIVVPSSFLVRYGRLDAGNLASLAADDGNPLRTCKFLVPNLGVAPITVEVDGATSVASPAGIRLAVRSRFATVGNYRQTLDMWDWVAGQFDPVDVRNDTLTNPYNSVELVGTGNIGRYRGTGGALRARYRIVPTGPVASAAWCVEHDRVNWIVTP